MEHGTESASRTCKGQGGSNYDTIYTNVWQMSMFMNCIAIRTVSSVDFQSAASYGVMNPRDPMPKLTMGGRAVHTRNKQKKNIE